MIVNPDTLTAAGEARPRQSSAGNKKRPPSRMTGRYLPARYDAARHMLTIIGRLLIVLNLTLQPLGFILHTFDTQHHMSRH